MRRRARRRPRGQGPRCQPSPSAPLATLVRSPAFPARWEWGRWDLNPGQRVSTRRGATPPVSRNLGSSLQSVITESANPLSVKPVTGARQSTRLAYVPLPTAENAGSYVVFLPRSVRTSPRRARPRGLRPAAGPWSCRIGSRVSSGTVYPAGPRGPSPPPRSPSSRGGRRGRPSRVP